MKDSRPQTLYSTFFSQKRLENSLMSTKTSFHPSTDHRLTLELEQGKDTIIKLKAELVQKSRDIALLRVQKKQREDDLKRTLRIVEEIVKQSDKSSVHAMSQISKAMESNQELPAIDGKVNLTSEHKTRLAEIIQINELKQKLNEQAEVIRYQEEELKDLKEKQKSPTITKLNNFLSSYTEFNSILKENEAMKFEYERKYQESEYQREQNANLQERLKRFNDSYHNYKSSSHKEKKKLEGLLQKAKDKEQSCRIFHQRKTAEKKGKNDKVYLSEPNEGNGQADSMRMAELELQRLRKKVYDLTHGNDELSTQLNQVKKAQKEKDDKLRGVIEENERLCKARDDLQLKNTSIEKEKKQLQLNANKLNTEMTYCNRSTDEKDALLSEKEALLSQCKQKNKDLEKQMSRMKEVIEEYHSLIAENEAKCEEERNKNGALKELMDESEGRYEAVSKKLTKEKSETEARAKEIEKMSAEIKELKRQLMEKTEKKASDDFFPTQVKLEEDRKRPISSKEEKAEEEASVKEEALVKKEELSEVKYSNTEFKKGNEGVIADNNIINSEKSSSHKEKQESNKKHHSIKDKSRSSSSKVDEDIHQSNHSHHSIAKAPEQKEEEEYNEDFNQEKNSHSDLIEATTPKGEESLKDDSKKQTEENLPMLNDYINNQKEEQEVRIPVQPPIELKAEGNEVNDKASSDHHNTNEEGDQFEQDQMNLQASKKERSYHSSQKQSHTDKNEEKFEGIAEDNQSEGGNKDLLDLIVQGKEETEERKPEEEVNPSHLRQLDEMIIANEGNDEVKDLQPQEKSERSQKSLSKASVHSNEKLSEMELNANEQNEHNDNQEEEPVSKVPTDEFQNLSENDLNESELIKAQSIHSKQKEVKSIYSHHSNNRMNIDDENDFEKEEEQQVNEEENNQLIRNEVRQESFNEVINHKSGAGKSQIDELQLNEQASSNKSSKRIKNNLPPDNEHSIHRNKSSVHNPRTPPSHQSKEDEKFPSHSSENHTHSSQQEFEEENQAQSQHAPQHHENSNAYQTSSNISGKIQNPDLSDEFVI